MQKNWFTIFGVKVTVGLICETTEVWLLNWTQNVTIFTVSSNLPVHLQPNLIVQHTAGVSKGKMELLHSRSRLQ